MAADVETIEKVRVILDRKTFTRQERALFTDRVRSQSQDVLGQGHRYDVTVLWSDESGATGFEDGLFLAHHLSRLAREALEAGTEVTLAQELGIPWTDLFYDATPDVIAPE